MTKNAQQKSLRAHEWERFSDTVLRHIENYSVPQYGDKPDDEAESWTPEECVKQIGKYVARFESNMRGPDERKRDLMKAAHYAGLAYMKLQEKERL